MSREYGRDFQIFKDQVRQIPEVKDHLESFSVIIGDLVLARRIQMGLSQKELAELAKTTQSTISRIEAAETVKSDTLDQVFKVLKLQSIIPKFKEDASTEEVYR